MLIRLSQFWGQGSPRSRHQQHRSPVILAHSSSKVMVCCCVLQREVLCPDLAEDLEGQGNSLHQAHCFACLFFVFRTEGWISGLYTCKAYALPLSWTFSPFKKKSCVSDICVSTGMRIPPGACGGQKITWVSASNLPPCFRWGFLFPAAYSSWAGLRTSGSSFSSSHLPISGLRQHIHWWGWF